LVCHRSQEYTKALEGLKDLYGLSLGHQTIVNVAQNELFLLAPWENLIERLKKAPYLMQDTICLRNHEV